MLYAGSDGIQLTDASALEASYTRSANQRTQVGIFSRPFHHTTPARIAGNVDHRSISPVKSVGRCFFGSDACRFFDKLEIPAGRLAQRYWENCFMTVNNVVTKKQRDMKACFFHGYFLKVARELRRVCIEDRADFAGPDVFFISRPYRRARHVPITGI